MLQVQPSVAAPVQSSAQQQQVTQHQASKAPNRPSSAPPTSPSHRGDASTGAGGRPDCFQSLSGLQPGMLSACSNSSLMAPGGSPSLASAAANAATADAVRPFIRGGYSYMSKCATHYIIPLRCMKDKTLPKLKAGRKSFLERFAILR